MKKGWTVGLLGLFAVLALMPLSAALAADEGPRVSVDFKGATMQEAANFLAVKAGVNIVVEKGVAGFVNLRVNDVSWLEALNLAAKQVGCTAEKREDNIWHIVTPHFSFTTKAEGVSLKQVISLLAQQSGQNIVVAPNVDAVVHFSLQDVPWQIALDTIVKTAGPFAVVRDEAGVYSIVKADSLSEQLSTKVFALKYIQAPSEYKPKITTEFAERSSSTTSGGSSSGGGGGDKALRDNFTLYRALSNVIGSKGTVQYDFDSNSFIVTTTKPLLDQVAEIVRLCDVAMDQVFIDVKFVTTAHTDLLNAGVRYPKGFMITGSGGSMVTKLPFDLNGGGAWLDTLSVTGQGPTDADVDKALGGKSPFTFGVIDFSNITPVLEFLKTDSESQIVQAPSLTVIDNKAATVFVGEQIHFAEEFTTTSQSGGQSRGIREASVNSPIKVGTQLMVMPHIVPDTDKIVLAVIPTSEQLTGTSSPAVPGFERFSIGDQFIDLPRLASRTVVTTMVLEDGQTAVIGGLINQLDTKTVTKLPFLGDIPLLGWLFKNTQNNNDINNLYIFITVRIIHNNTRDMESLFSEYHVAGADIKPYKPGDQVKSLIGPLTQTPSLAPAGDPTGTPAAPSPDVVGHGWEETSGEVKNFDVK